MSLFERIKNKRYELQEVRKKFPGDKSGAYQQAKDDLEARKGFSKNKPGGLKADEKNPYVKRSVRKTRVDKLGGDIYDAPKFSQKKFDKQLKNISKGPRTNIVDPFGKGDTPGQQKVKAMDKKAFKVTQPRDIKQTKGYKPYEKLSKDIKDLKKGTRNISSMNPSEMERAFGTSSTEGSAGASGSSKTKVVKQSEVSKKAKDFTKNINQKRVSSSGYSQANKPKPGSEPTLFKKVKPKTSKIPITPSEVVGSTPFDAKSGTKRKVNITKNLTRKNKGFKEPIKIKKTRNVKTTNVKTPKLELPNFVKNKTVNISQKAYRKAPQSPQLVTDINVRNVPREIRFAKTSQKVLAKTPKAIKPIARPALKLLAKAGTPGRIAAAGLGVAAISPAGRKALGQLATGVGLTALFGRRKTDKQLKVGDGLTKVSNMPSKYQPKGMKSGTFKEPGSNKVRGTGDVRVRFDLASGGGRVRNPKDVARVKNIQKNYIDDYNKKAAKNPLKKQIKYSVNKDGSYTVTPPKKK